MAEMGVRRDKAALSSGCKPHPAIRSSRKQPATSRPSAAARPPPREFARRSPRPTGDLWSRAFA